MSQESSQSNSPLPKGCGCSLLVLVGLISAIVLLVQPLFLTFGIKDKQVDIYLPSFLSIFLTNANKAMQSEAKQYVSSMNRAQQAYYAENSAFSSYIPAWLGIKTETNNYKYSTRATQTAAFNYGVAKKPELKSYVGAVFLVPAYPNAAKNEMMTTSILCETTEKRPLFRVKKADEPDEPAEPIYQNGEVICGKGTTEVTR
jgi:type IV pilus assembly protein PilA